MKVLKKFILIILILSVQACKKNKNNTTENLPVPEPNATSTAPPILTPEECSKVREVSNKIILPSASNVEIYNFILNNRQLFKAYSNKKIDDIWNCIQK